MSDQFTWIAAYKEIASRLRTYRTRQQELLDLISTLKSRGLQVISTVDKDASGRTFPLAEIDPFTFFANFNRGIRTATRIEIIRFIIENWKLTCSVPTDLTGIPVVNNQQSWFIMYKANRGSDDVPLLWDLFEEALDNNIDPDTFNKAVGLRYIKFNITMGLFWIAPEIYLNLDSVNRQYLGKKGIAINDVPDYATYVEYMSKTKALFNTPFFEISHSAWLADNEPVVDKPTPPQTKNSQQYWLYAPGRGGEHWEEFHRAGIMAIGWDYLGDLGEYPSKESIATAMRTHDNDQDSSKKNDATSCFAFVNEMKVGDVVFAKIGSGRIIGRGEIQSDYKFDPSRGFYKHVRQVKWQKRGEWTVSAENKFALKTITNATPYPNFVRYLESLLGGSPDEGTAPTPTAAAFWWLNANPKIWDLAAAPVGSRQKYSSHNPQGNKRRVYQYFTLVKPEDILVGYVASPRREVVAICKVTQSLHNGDNGEVFEFEKIEQLPTPVRLYRLQKVPELAKCEPLLNNQGSLFKLTAAEYETIRSIIDEENEGSSDVTRTEPTYTIEQCSEATGYSVDRIAGWKDALERKKQAVFFGPPGTGKTYIANHLAKHLVADTDGFVELVQFHPAYAYEDFIQGIRPETSDGGSLTFDRIPGRFLTFCLRARQRGGPCVLIIDEINRANLSRVFGELMYLLEYRDVEISLAGGERFSIPPNVRLIGTMNTADRSIALVDFALRRRFAFIELRPEYDILVAYQRHRGFDATRLVSILREMNNKINDKNYSLGISFFMVDNLLDNLERIWTTEIETYLEEFFFSQPDVVDGFRWRMVRAQLSQ